MSRNSHSKRSPQASKLSGSIHLTDLNTLLFGAPEQDVLGSLAEFGMLMNPKTGKLELMLRMRVMVENKR